MTQTTITRNGKEYTLWLNDKNEAIGCNCNQRKALEAYGFKPCLHMIDWKQRQRDAARTAYLNYCLMLGI